MKSTQTTHGTAGSELRIIGGLLKMVWDDLFRHIRQVRPLPPLPTDAPPLLWLPEGLRRYARWLPHAVILLGALVAGWIMAVVEGGRFRYAYYDVNYYYGGGDETLAVPAGVLLGLSVALVLLRPLAAWWLSTAVATAVALADFTSTWPFPPVVLICHITVMALVAARSRPRVAVEMWLVTVGVCLAAERIVASYGKENTWVMIIASLAVLSALAMLRGWWRSRQEVDKQVAVTAVERSKRTLLEERTTIARELHDVVAHHMSVVAIQAEAAPYRVSDPPPELVKAFGTIRENALTALTELRRVLGVVRSADYEAPDAPQPTLADLDALLGNVREAGLRVEKAVTGAVRELPHGIELSAYRIIQEALSNSLRHAPGSVTRVEISYVLGGLGLRVVNGPPRTRVAPSPGAGHGITGMRERVAMLGGEMTCGPTGDGGYETAVFVPMPPAEGNGGNEGNEGPEGTKGTEAGVGDPVDAGGETA